MSLLLITIIKVIVIFAGLVVTVSVMTLAERKVSAFIQLRHLPKQPG